MVAWFMAAGVKPGKKLKGALVVCAAEDIEEVGDLLALRAAGRLGNQGFKDIVLVKILTRRPSEGQQQQMLGRNQRSRRSSKLGE